MNLQNRTVAFHAARAVKVLLLDDALRGQVRIEIRGIPIKGLIMYL